jgi:hypothetical protein
MNDENLYEDVSAKLGRHPLPNTTPDAILIAAAILYVGELLQEAFYDENDGHLRGINNALWQLADKLAPAK